MIGETSLDELARRAIDGDRTALESLVRGMQGDIFALALRMLWNREDAEDAVQEILIRVVTRLSTFHFQSRLKTWVYRIAVNYLLDVKKSAVERMNLTFVRMADDLNTGLVTEGAAENERSQLLDEVKIGCTLAMLQCLDRPHRVTYILCEIFELSAPEAAEAMGIEPDTLRKRLERARASIVEFTQSYCGLVSDQAACRCVRRLPAALALGRVRKDSLQFAQREVSFNDVRAAIRRVDDTRRAVEVHRTNHPRLSSADIARQIVAALDP